MRPEVVLQNNLTGLRVDALEPIFFLPHHCVIKHNFHQENYYDTFHALSVKSVYLHKYLFLIDCKIRSYDASK